MTDTQASSSQPIRFFHRGQVVEVQGVHPTRSVLDWLREDARCTGTKEGCNEGDCGACTVVIGELAAPGSADAVGGLKLQTVNACIQFLPTLHGKALFTVEDLKAQCGHAHDGDRHSKHAVRQLHPVQQALVDCHGSQCGFCTPGFVMSLFGMYQNHVCQGREVTRALAAEELSGNLCRCTGYRPILDAAQQMQQLPRVPVDEAALLQQLELLALDGSALEPDLAYIAPTTLADLLAARAAHPQTQVVAGATDVGLWITKQHRRFDRLLDVTRARELRTLAEQADQLTIGAAVPLADAFARIESHWPQLHRFAARFAGLPVRNSGTLGGNVANGSPIGDSPPILMALDAQIELRKGAAVRRMPLPDFYLDYMKNQLQPGEFVQGLSIPLAAFSRQLRGYKISKRFDCDISALCAGFAVELDGETVKSIRLAYGGMAATVRRAALAEAALAGRPWTQASVDAAKAALAQDFKPLTDMRASADYRLQVAQNLLQRLWLETRPQDALPPQATSVWSVMPHHAVA